MGIVEALTIVSILLIVTISIGFLIQKRKVRIDTSINKENIVTPKDLGLSADDEFGNLGTVIQFSTQFCSRCPGTARLLTAESQKRSGIKHIEIDLTNRIDLAKEFNVLQTPTTLILDKDGRVRSRIVGPPTATDFHNQLDRIL